MQFSRTLIRKFSPALIALAIAAGSAGMVAHMPATAHAAPKQDRAGLQRLVKKVLADKHLAKIMAVRS